MSGDSLATIASAGRGQCTPVDLDGDTFLAFLEREKQLPPRGQLGDKDLAYILDETVSIYDGVRLYGMPPWRDLSNLSIYAEAIRLAIDRIVLRDNGSLTLGVHRTTGGPKELQKRRALISRLANVYQALWDKCK